MDVSPRFSQIPCCLLKLIVLLMAPGTKSELTSNRCDVNGPGAVTPGDANVALLLDIHSALGEKCGDVNPSAVQELLAVDFVFSRLNEEGYIPGVKIGSVTYDTCSLLPRATGSLRHLMSVLDNRYVPDGCNNNTNSFFGIVGPSTSAEAIAVAQVLEAEFPTNRLLQISHSATASAVTPSSEFSNSFRVVPPDDLQAKAILDLVKQLGWNYAGLMFTDDIYGESGADIILNLANASGICFAFVEKIPSDLDACGIQKSIRRILMHGGNTRQKASGVVFFGSAGGAVKVLQEALLYEEKIHFIFSDAVQFRPDVFHEHLDVSGGVLVVEPAYSRLEHFEQYLRDIYTNVSRLTEKAKNYAWLEELYRVKTNCPSSTSLSSCSPLNAADIQTLTTTSVFTYYITRVAYIYAKLIKALYTETCPLPLCSSLQSVSRESIYYKLLSLNLNFQDEFVPFGLDKISDGFVVYNLSDPRNSKNFGQSNTVYQVTSFQRGSCSAGTEFCFFKVGTYDGETLSVDLTKIKNYDKNEVEIERVISQCVPGALCDACVKEDAHKEWVYIPGDILIVGLVPVYDSGNSAFSCSGIRLDSGLQLVEAILFALKKINQKQGIFSSIYPDKTIGAIIMNTCFSETVSQRGTLSVFFDSDPYLMSKVRNVSSQIIGFIGPLRSDASESVASLLTHLKLCQVSYGSTSVSLNNKEMFPYFSRTCTDDEEQSKVIVVLLKDLGWKYFSIVYEDDAYGQNGFKAIQTLSTQHSLCIAEAIKIDGSTNYFKVLEQLRQAPSAGAVVLFVHSSTAAMILQAFSQKDNYQPREFIFIMTESVGNRPSVIEGNRAAEGAISLLQALPGNSEFNEYLSKKMSSKDLPENVWFDNYWGLSLQCYLPGSYNKSSGVRCPQNLTLTGGKYSQDPWVPFVVNSVYSLVLGSDMATGKLCSAKGDWCSDARNDPRAVLDEVLKTRLDLFGTGTVSSVFNEAGNGVVEFKILNIQANQSKDLHFYEVGYWNQNGGLALNTDQLKFPGQTTTPSFECPNKVACDRCETFANPRPISEECSAEPSYALSVSTGVLGALVLVLVLVLAFWKLKTITKMRSCEGSDPRFERRSTEYLHAVDVYSSINDQGNNETTLSNLTGSPARTPQMCRRYSNEPPQSESSPSLSASSPPQIPSSPPQIPSSPPQIPSSPPPPPCLAYIQAKSESLLQPQDCGST